MKQIPGQLTIFDFLRPRSEIEALSIEEIASIVGKSIGLTFRQNDFWVMESRKNGMMFEISKDTYDTFDQRDGTAFLAVGWRGKHEGGGAPADSIEEAIEYFRGRLCKRREEKE